MEPVYIDIGNTQIKVAEKDGLEWKILFQAGHENVGKACDMILQKKGGVRVSSVRSDVTRLVKEKLKGLDVKVLKSTGIPAFNLDYETPKTLGMDRFLVCLGARNLTSSGVVVIDAGSACTIDLMTADNVYRGGVIMPGLRAFHKAMGAWFPELPEVDVYLPGNWPGRTTTESIQWGVNGSFFFSIRFFIEKYRQDMDDVSLFVTGGDAPEIIQHLGNYFRFRHRPGLIFDGMAEFEKWV